MLRKLLDLNNFGLKKTRSGAQVMFFKQIADYEINNFEKSLRDSYNQEDNEIISIKNSFYSFLDKNYNMPDLIKRAFVICYNHYRDLGYEPSEFTYYAVKKIISKIDNGEIDSKNPILIDFLKNIAQYSHNMYGGYSSTLKNGLRRLDIEFNPF